MSNHVSLTLSSPEEALACDFSSKCVPLVGRTSQSPIDEYFAATDALVGKIIRAPYAGDSEVLGLLVLGTISAAEFYFRSIIAETVSLCALSETVSDAVNVPLGAYVYYKGSGYSPVMSAYEHESLADSAKIASEIKRFTGVLVAADTSVKKALEDFELLCELRHCFVHAKGFAGLKAARKLGLPNKLLHKVEIPQAEALDLIKLSHNVVRAINRKLANEIVNRWIDKDILTGRWQSDRNLFNKYMAIFARTGEDAYAGDGKTCYMTISPIIKARRRAMAIRVAS